MIKRGIQPLACMQTCTQPLHVAFPVMQALPAPPPLYPVHSPQPTAHSAWPSASLTRAMLVDQVDGHHSLVLLHHGGHVLVVRLQGGGVG